MIDTRIIMQYVLKSNACAVILAHNHPSGSLKASEADKKITRKIDEALSLFDVALLDHLIITNSQYFSIMEF